MVSSLTSRCAGVLIVAAAWLPGAWAGTIGGSLEWAAHDHGLLKASSWLPVLVRFRQPPTAAELEALEARGLLTWRRYQGRVLGTHIRRQGNRVLYEVRILRPDDRIILVYLDAETGGVVGDSEQSDRLDMRRAFGDTPSNNPPSIGQGFAPNSGERRPRGEGGFGRPPRRGNYRRN